jgi:hypothetical protein
MTLVARERVNHGTASRRIHFERSYERVFIVTDDGGAAFSQQNARNASGIPAIGSTYTDALGGADPSAFCVDLQTQALSADEQGHGKAWIVKASYQAPARSRQQNPNRDPATLTANPLTRPPDWEFYTEGKAKIFEKVYAFVEEDGTERSNHPVTNSAGDPIEYEREEKWVVLRYTRNEALSTWQSDPVNWIKWVDATNNATFLGGAVRTWRILDIRATKIFEAATEGSGGTSYMQVTYILAYREAGWDDELLDRGANYIDAVTGKKLRAVDDKNNTLGWVPLDGTGKRLTESQIAARNFKYRKFRPCIPRTFASIPGGAITLT